MAGRSVAECWLCAGTVPKMLLLAPLATCMGKKAPPHNRHHRLDLCCHQPAAGTASQPPTRLPLAWPASQPATHLPLARPVSHPPASRWHTGQASQPPATHPPAWWPCTHTAQPGASHSGTRSCPWMAASTRAGGGGWGVRSGGGPGRWAVQQAGGRFRLGWARVLPASFPCLGGGHVLLINPTPTWHGQTSCATPLLLPSKVHH